MTRFAFMATNFLTKIFGSRNDRLLKQYRQGVAQINAMEAGLAQLSDDELRGKTACPAARGLCGGSRGLKTHYENAAFRCSDAGRHVLA
jgi:preprotein translocase subunit SecA